MSKNKHIQAVEASQLRDDIPEFAPGDTVTVDVRVVEGSRERLQPFEGVVLSVKNRGLGSSFIVRKISNGLKKKLLKFMPADQSYEQQIPRIRRINR